MKEIYHLTNARKIMSELNIIVYGTIRDIEKHFLNSFSNIELLTHYFNNTYIIILENDSKDNTRHLLTEWYQSNHSSNIKKHIVLLDNLDEKFPLRAHRLAYCRNIILKYIFNNHLNHNYQYAFHCDLDDRFWSINFDSICNCFQYDFNQWDMISGVNKNYSYYDWWALRCENTWFNKNIFSCETDDIYYESKIDGFCDFLKKNQLISVNSAFNGLGIYKLSSMKNCYYSANYYCNKCHNEKRGCKEDNDHIGLHRQMKEKSCKLFINTKFNITTLPEYGITYNDFIIDNKNKIPNLNKDPLYYVLVNPFIPSEGVWLNFGIKDGEVINQISKNTEKNVFSFDEFENTSFKKEGDSIIYNFQKFKEEIQPFLNKNIKIFPGSLYETISSFKKKYLNNEIISFIYVHSSSYQTTKQILYSFVDKINNGCIIVFNEFINYKNFFIYEFKAFYEFVQELKINYEFIGSHEIFQMKSQEIKNSRKSVAIRIIKNPLNYDSIKNNFEIDEDFDWKFYRNTYEDLKHVTSEEEAKHHWFHYGLKEGRICKNNKSQKKDIFDKKKFDWIYYISKYDDLKHIQIEEEAWHHWINYGYKEGRNDKKIKPEKNKKEREKEKREREKIEKEEREKEAKEREEREKEAKEREEREREQEKEREIYKNITYSFTQSDYENFDWDYYVHKYNDLSSIPTKEEAWNHWVNFGSKEGRSCDSFDWFLYLQLNPDLGQNGITTREGAIYHWNHYGKKEGRKYM